MDRKSAWIVAGSVVAGFLVLGLTQVFAQRFPADERPAGAVGRYRVVRATADAVLLLDTVTGDLYTAVPGDARPYNSRPGAGRTDGFGFKKDGVRKDALLPRKPTDVKVTDRKVTDRKDDRPKE